MFRARQVGTRGLAMAAEERIGWRLRLREDVDAAIARDPAVRSRVDR